MYVVLSKGDETVVQVASKKIKNLDSVMPFTFSDTDARAKMSEIMCLGPQMRWSITDILV